jgi:hypothetical protein
MQGGKAFSLLERFEDLNYKDSEISDDKGPGVESFKTG